MPPQDHGKEVFLTCADNSTTQILYGHQLMKNHQTYCLEKLNSREIYRTR